MKYIICKFIQNDLLLEIKIEKNLDSSSTISLNDLALNKTEGI